MIRLYAWGGDSAKHTSTEQTYFYTWYVRGRAYADTHRERKNTATYCSSSGRHKKKRRNHETERRQSSVSSCSIYHSTTPNHEALARPPRQHSIAQPAFHSHPSTIKFSSINHQSSPISHQRSSTYKASHISHQSNIHQPCINHQPSAKQHAAIIHHPSLSKAVDILYIHV